MKIFLTLLRIVLGIGMLYYVISITESWSGAREVIDRPLLVLGFLLLPFFGAAVESIRLGLLCKPQDLHVSFLNGYRLAAISALFNFVVPGGTGGDVSKLYYLATENRGHTVEIATILIVDRALALFALLVLIILLALLNLQVLLDLKAVQLLVGMAAAGIIVLLLVMAVSFSRGFRQWSLYRHVCERFRWGKYIDRMFLALYSFRHHKQSLMAAVIVSMAGHVTLMAMFILLATVILPDVSPVTIVLFSLLGMLANALPVTPGGIGVGEAAFEWLFGLLGQSGGAQLIMAWRIGMLPVCILGGLYYIAGRRRYQAADGGPGLARPPDTNS
jgi:uncharacterized protein (TIRG00374 family)